MVLVVTRTTPTRHRSHGCSPSYPPLAVLPRLIAHDCPHWVVVACRTPIPLRLLPCNTHICPRLLPIPPPPHTGYPLPRSPFCCAGLLVDVWFIAVYVPGYLPVTRTRLYTTHGLVCISLPAYDVMTRLPVTLHGDIRYLAGRLPVTTFGTYAVDSRLLLRIAVVYNCLITLAHLHTDCSHPVGGLFPNVTVTYRCYFPCLHIPDLPTITTFATFLLHVANTTGFLTPHTPFTITLICSGLRCCSDIRCWLLLTFV